MISLKNYLFGTSKEMKSDIKKGLERMKRLETITDIISTKGYSPEMLDMQLQVNSVKDVLSDIVQENLKENVKNTINTKVGTLIYAVSSGIFAGLLPPVGIPLVVDGAVRWVRMMAYDDMPIGIFGTIREYLQK